MHEKYEWFKFSRKNASMQEQRLSKLLRVDLEGWQIFSFVCLPILLVGAVLWNISAMLYSGYLGGSIVIFSVSNYILITILYFGLWAACLVFAFYQKNIIAMILFFGCAWVTGMLEYPIMIWAASSVGLDLAIKLFAMANIIGIFATATAICIGIALHRKFSEEAVWAISSVLAISGLSFIILEIILFMLFGFDQIILWTSLIFLIWIIGSTIFDGMRLEDDMEEGAFMFSVVQIFLDYIIIVIRIFLIFVSASSKSISKKSLGNKH